MYFILFISTIQMKASHTLIKHSMRWQIKALGNIWRGFFLVDFPWYELPRWGLELWFTF